MILKASQRGGGKQLGLHLMKTEENEHVEVHEIRGFVSNDIVGALKEAYAVSRGTRCKQFLFSVSLNPPPATRVPVETFENAITRIEERNGLSGHPRIVVFHEKEGRRHAHAVWSRIDAESMTAKNLPHFKLKLRDLSRELYLENDWKMPRGLMNSFEADPRNFTLKEWQQSKRMGRDARDLKEMMQECWAVSDTHAAFAQALKARGVTLAKGDRRGFVALTSEGEVLSVARYVGKKTKDVKVRLGNPEHLPTVSAARAELAKDLSLTFKRHLREADEEKRRDLVPLTTQRQAMAAQQRQERASVHVQQEQRWAAETRARMERFAPGLRGLWSRLTGKHAQVQRQNEREAYEGLIRDREQRQALIDSQMTDRQALQHQIRGVRERHAALLKELRQDQERVQPPVTHPDMAKDFSTRAANARPSTEERLHRLRSGHAQSQTDRPRDFDRER